jgi:hypothetical protein
MEQEIKIIQENIEETTVLKSSSKELFEDYEINKRSVTSSFQKIIAGTVVFHILAIAILSQTGLGLGKSRACQNPFIQTVCEVIDMAYVGTVLAGTDRTSVDSDYIKTELEDAEVTFIDVTNMPPAFSYPEDYFSVANSESVPQEIITDATGNPITNDTIAGIPGFPNSTNGFPNSPNGFPANPTTNDLDLGKAVLPTPNPNTLSGPMPSGSFGRNPIPATKGNNKSKFPAGFPTPKNTRKEKTLQNKSPNELPDFDLENEVASTKPKNPREPAGNSNKGVTQNLNNGNVTPTPEKFNKRPLKDFGKDVNKQLANKQIDLNSPVALMMKGVLTKDGKLDPTKSKFVSAQGDEKMVKVIQSGIMAINDSGYLVLLEQLSGKTLDISFLQDDANIIAEVQSEMESDTRAKTTKGLLDLAIKFGKSKKNAAILDPKNTEIQNDKDELALLETAVVKIVGKKVIISFNVTKDFAQEMIARKLKDLADDEAKENKKINKLDDISENKNANIAKK